MPRSKKFLAFLLTLAMCFSLFPASALADEGDGADTADPSTPAVVETVESEAPTAPPEDAPPLSGTIPPAETPSDADNDALDLPAEPTPVETEPVQPEPIETAQISLLEAEPATPTKILVMSTTDMHGKVWDTNVLTDDAVYNSFLGVAKVVGDLRGTYGQENTILVDNGDLFQGTPISTNSITAGTGGGSNPMSIALRYLEYDAFVLGNHEFNYPWDTMKEIYDYLEAPADDDHPGAPVPVLAANLYDKDTGKNALGSYIIKEFAVEGTDEKFRVGIVGFENTDCTKFDAANFGNTTLTPEGNPTRDMVPEAQKYVDILRNDEGCDYVIVSYHAGMGGGNTDPDEPLTLYTDTENQVKRMVAGTTGIDLVIAGHDHSAYKKKVAANKEGIDIPVVDGGGSQLTQVELSVSYADGKFTAITTDKGNQSMSKNTGVDEGLKALIEPYATAAAAKVATVCGTAVGTWDGSQSYKLGQTDSIDLINRAEIWRSQVESEKRGDGVKDFALDIAATTSIPNGSNTAIKAGDVTIKDIYKIYKYDNYVYTIPMTGQQLKDWLEGIGAFYKAKISDGNVSYTVDSNFVTALFYGLDFQYDVYQEVGSRVVGLKLSKTGEAIDLTKTYNVGVNNYLIGQDPFVTAMKGSNTEENKQAILDMALWSSQEALGPENGLVTQMAADFVAAETESKGGVSPAPSGWSLTYSGSIEEPDVPEGSGSPYDPISDKVLTDNSAISIAAANTAETKTSVTTVGQVSYIYGYSSGSTGEARVLIQDVVDGKVVGIQLALSDDISGTLPVSVGDIVKAEGTRSTKYGIPELTGVKVTKLGTDHPFAPELVTVEQADSGKYLNRYILLRDVILGAYGDTLTLTDNVGNSIAVYRGASFPANLKAGDKADIYAVGSTYNESAQLRVGYSSNYSPAGVWTDPIPDSVFTAGTTNIAESYQLPSGTENVTIIGQVTYTFKNDPAKDTVNNSVMIQDLIGGKIVGMEIFDYNHSDLYRVGNVVRVTGTVSLYNGVWEIQKITAAEVLYTAEPFRPQELTIADLEADTSCDEYNCEYIVLRDLTLGTYDGSKTSIFTDSAGKTVKAYRAAEYPKNVTQADVYAACVKNSYNSSNSYQLRVGSTSDYGGSTGAGPDKPDYSTWDRIPVFETTDVHGFIMDTSSGVEDTFQYRLAYIANVVNKARADKANKDVLLLDGGDIYQGTPVSNKTMGNSLRAAFDAMKYDAVALGNHEFDWDVKQYATDANGTMPAYEVPVAEGNPIKGDSDIPVVCATLYDAETKERVGFTKDYAVVTKAGYTVLIVGYAPDYSSDIMTAKISPYTLKGDLADFKAKVAEYQNSVKADVVIVLAHQSPAGLAKAMDPDVVDLVLGGHSHTSASGVAENGIPYLQGNCQGKGYATATIYVDPETKEVAVEDPAYVNITATADLPKLYDTPENADKLDAEVLRISKAAWASVKGEMSEVLGHVTTDISKSTVSACTSTAGSWLTDLMNRATGSQIAFTNNGGIRVSLTIPEGATQRDITVGDVYTISPFGNKLMTYDLTGQQLADLMVFALSQSSLGLRFSGAMVEYYGSGKDITITKITMGDGTVAYPASDPAKTYKICVNEYIATLSGTPFVELESTNQGHEPIDNESAIEELRKEGKVNGGLLKVDTSAHTKKVSNPDSMTIGIYSTTDMHGKCYDLNPVGGTFTDSYLKVATAMKAERESMDGTLLVDNGDILQGTAITSYNINIENGVNNPMAIALRYCGYDAFIPGNHEFNFNLDVQKKFYDMLADDTGALPGSPVAAVCANLIDTETGKPAAPYTPYTIKEFTVGGKTFRIGILGFENMNVPNWDLPSHYAGMSFGHADNPDGSYVYEWENYWKTQLREVEKCDIVIVSAHSGEGSGEKYDKESQVAWLISHTDGIDMVIAGHNHRPGINTFKNKSGADVPCVNGGCTNLTKTVLTLNKDGSFSFGESTAISLKSVETNDPGLKALIAPAYDKAAAFVTEPIGTLSGTWDTVNSYHTTQSDSYDLVHKAQLWATGADVSITTPVAKSNVNGISGKFKLVNLFEEGATSASISLKDCYSLYQYDNNLLYGITMTGKQLKDWLEHCATTYRVSGEGNISGGGFGTDIAYGINYDVYLGNAEGERIVNMTLADGTPVKDTTKLKVALSSYRLSATEGSDEYGWYATTGITSTSDNVYFDASTSPEFGAVGGSVTLILGEYIKQLCKDGGTVTPGSETHWALHADTYTPSHSSGGSGGGTSNSTIKVGTDSVTVKLNASRSLTSAQQKQLVTANADKPIIITGKGLSVVIPAGTLTTGANIKAMLVDPNKSGNVIQVTHADGTTSLLPFAVVGSGAASYIADREGTYRIIDNTKTFPDVDSSYWAADAIGFVTAHEFFLGTDSGTFDSEASMTRAMLVTVLARIDGGKATASSSFSDVPTDAWYSDAVNWAAENGIVKGTGSGFDPDGTVTREQLCTILGRYIGHAKLQISTTASAIEYDDLDAVSSWAADSVNFCLGAGLITGRPESYIDPQGQATRAEIAMFMMRLIQSTVK